MVVVPDTCDDDSEGLAGRFGPDVHFVSVDAANVGATRAAGFEYARSLFAGVDTIESGLKAQPIIAPDH